MTFDLADVLEHMRVKCYGTLGEAFEATVADALCDARGRSEPMPPDLAAVEALWGDEE